MKYKNLKGAVIKIYFIIFDLKSVIGLYFMGFAMIYLLIGTLAEGMDITINLAKSFQMFGASTLIGFGQYLVTRRDKFSIKTCTLSALWPCAITILSTEFFGWFAAFPSWCKYCFYGLLFFGIFSVWIIQYIKSESETLSLNEKLKQYQNQDNSTDSSV